MTLQANAVATAISQLSIPGLRIRDLTRIPKIVEHRECPIMIPSVQFITNLVTIPSNLDSPNGFWTCNRDLNYWVLYNDAGTARGTFEHIPGMVKLADSITTAVLSMDINGVDIIGVKIGNFGTVTEPNGDEFYGFPFAIVISEFVNQ